MGLPLTGAGKSGGPVDTTAPTVVITSTAATITDLAAIPVTITSSKKVTGFVVGDIAVSNGTAGNFATADNIVFTADITPTANGLVTVDINAAVCADAAGNDNEAATQWSIIAVKLWMRGDSLSGNDGDLIASWASKNTTYNFTAAGAARPTLKTGANGINGQNVARFDGTGTILSLASAILTGSSGTVLAVVRFTSPLTGPQDVLSSGDEASATRFLSCQGDKNGVSEPNMSLFQRNNDTYDWLKGDTSLTAGTYRLMWSSSGTTYTFKVNDTTQTPTIINGANTGDWWGDTSARDNTNIGATKINSVINYLFGDIAEIIVTDGVELTGAPLATMEAYLATRYGPFEYATGFGDSITEGAAASDAAHRWINVVAASLGMDVVNAGLGATVLQNTVQNSVAVIGGAAANNGRDTYAARVVSYHPNYVFILYGLNDLRLNDVAFTVALFDSDLREVVDGLVAGGIAADHIVIGSPPYIPAASYSLDSPWDGATAEKYTDYIAACVSVATAKGTLYADIYQAMVDGGGDSLVSGDGIHPNDAGHAVIAETFLSIL